MRKLSRFISLPRQDRALLAYAFFCLAACRVGLWLVAAQTVRQQAQKLARRSRSPQPSESVVWAVRAAAGYVPGATCLTQALALQSLLARHGYPSSIHIGVLKEADGTFGAHAWVGCGDRIVLGGAEVDRYAPLLVWEEQA